MSTNVTGKTIGDYDIMIELLKGLVLTNPDAPPVSNKDMNKIMSNCIRKLTGIDKKFLVDAWQ